MTHIERTTVTVVFTVMLGIWLIGKLGVLTP